MTRNPAKGSIVGDKRRGRPRRTNVSMRVSALAASYRWLRPGRRTTYVHQFPGGNIAAQRSPYRAILKTARRSGAASANGANEMRNPLFWQFLATPANYFDLKKG